MCCEHRVDQVVLRTMSIEVSRSCCEKYSTGPCVSLLTHVTLDHVDELCRGVTVLSLCLSQNQFRIQDRTSCPVSERQQVIHTQVFLSVYSCRDTQVVSVVPKSTENVSIKGHFDSNEECPF